MSQIDKIQVEGIRSYCEPAVVEFFTPLTLIVGTNGAGKTTIIEALNYITTGDMPPNSKGAAFVCDPKVVGEQEVKGQVKLMFRDISGHRMIVTRSLVSTQKQKKIECKSIENVIKRKVNDDWRSISSRCTDINREMISLLGVSKPVLDCVIFCHQEDSLWPLSEGKALKTKFDDIFSATKYIKALEAIRKFRKEQSNELKVFNTQLEYLKENKFKADEISQNLERTKELFEKKEREIDDIVNSMMPVESRLIELSKIQQSINELERRLNSHLSTKKSIVEVNKDIEGKISKFFQGTKEELEKFAKNFEGQLKQKENELTNLEGKIQQKDVKCSALISKKNKILVNRGKLQEEFDRHKQNIEQRDFMIVEQSKSLQLEGFESSPFSDEQISSFKEKARECYQKIKTEGIELKEKYQRRIQSAQSKIDDKKKSLYQFEETIRVKNDMLTENQKKLQKIRQDLSNVSTSEIKLQRIGKDLIAAERELEDTKAAGNTGEWKNEVEKSQGEKRQVEAELMRLREEQQMMHLNSSIQAELDIKRKERDLKKDAIKEVNYKHEEELKSLLGSIGPTDNLKNRLNDFLNNKRSEIRDTNGKIQTLKQKQSSKLAEKRIIQKHVENLTKEKDGYERNLKEACGNEKYENKKKNLYDRIEEAKSKCSQLTAFETIYKKYVTTMEDKKKDPCCPLCHRQFNTLKEMQNLVTELKEKIGRVPDKMATQMAGLEKDEKVYENLQKLQFDKDNLGDIENKKLPLEKEKLMRISEDCDEIRNSIEELEDVLLVIENEDCRAAKIEPDLLMLEENQKSLKSLDREITLLENKLDGVAPGRSMQLVTNEISDCQDKVDNLNRIIERKRSQISNQESRLARLTSNVNELTSEKLRLSGELQRRSNLEKQKDDLTIANMEHDRDVREAKNNLEPIKEGLFELEKQRESLVNEQDEQIDQITSKLNEVKNNAGKLKEKMNEIQRYVDENRESFLMQLEKDLTLVEDEINDMNEERGNLVLQMDKLKDDLSQQKVRARELQDNIQFVTNEEKISSLEREISDIRSEQESLGDIDRLSREQNNLSRRLEEYKTRKATCTGERTGHEREMQRYKQDLSGPLYKDASRKYHYKLIEIKTTELANDDLEKYYKALDRAIMKFHSIKMSEINKIIKEYWINTYKGNDIDTIEIRSDEDSDGSLTTRRNYNYKVVMLKGDVALDMRGRCSAGQKVLASLIIRLALAETFCLNCGVLTLDEPTTNLDDENIESLANQLASIVRTRNPQKNFQLVVITHDEHFVELLSQADFVEYYYRVAKDENGLSRIYKQSTSGVNENV